MRWKNPELRRVNVVVSAVRIAVAALLVLVVDRLLVDAAGVGPAGLRLTCATLSFFVPLLLATVLLVRWKCSLAWIVGLLYGFEVIDVATIGVVEAGWAWLSFVNVTMWALLRGSIAIWPLCVPLALFLRRKS